MKPTPRRRPKSGKSRASATAPKLKPSSGFFRVFVWLDEQTEDGHVDFFTHEDADEIGELTGLGEALETVRWILFGPTGAVVANWDRHNGQSAKRRCLDAERKRSVRRASGQTSATEADNLGTR